MIYAESIATFLMDKIQEITAKGEDHKRKLVCDELAKTLYERTDMYRLDQLYRLYVNIEQGHIISDKNEHGLAADKRDVQQVGEPDDDRRSIMTATADPNAFNKLMECIIFTNDSRDCIYQSELLDKYKSLNGKGRDTLYAAFEVKMSQYGCQKITEKRKHKYTKMKFKG